MSWYVSSVVRHQILLHGSLAPVPVDDLNVHQSLNNYAIRFIYRGGDEWVASGRG